MKILSVLMLIPLCAGAFEAPLELAGAYSLVFDNVEYDNPLEPRGDERTRFLQRLFIGAQWQPLEFVSLTGGLELEHDLADSIECETVNWDNFKLNPRITLVLELNDWGRISLGHLKFHLGAETVFQQLTDHPATGASWSGDLSTVRWNVVIARTEVVSKATKEIFFAGGTLAWRLDLGFLSLTPQATAAYYHSGGYDTADYQEFAPPDGVRKFERGNLGGGLALGLFGDALSLFGSYHQSRSTGGEGWGRLLRLGLGGRLGWFSLNADFYKANGYEGIRPLPALANHPNDDFRFLDVSVDFNAPLAELLSLTVTLRQGLFFATATQPHDNRNQIMAAVELSF